MKILLIGCGSMGGALLRGWLKKRLPYDFSVATPHEASLRAIDPDLPWYGNLEKIPQDFDVVVLGVKPMILSDVLKSYESVFASKPLVVSMVAGRKLSTYYDVLSPETPLVRIMPNLAVADGEGMTFVCTQSSLSQEHQKGVNDLTQAVGKSVWVDESLMNAATALASCGPGFVFELVHQLAAIGGALGLPQEIAALSARQMVIGAGAHLKQTDLSPAQLALNVGHPGSMTEAGLEVLREQGALYELFYRALKASQSRGEGF